MQAGRQASGRQAGALLSSQFELTIGRSRGANQTSRQAVNELFYSILYYSFRNLRLQVKFGLAQDDSDRRNL